jgi:hypothetical protein
VPRIEEIEFVNRTAELRALRARIPPFARQPTVTFLRSPSGFGKTRLTDRLVETIPRDGPTCVIVDPAIRSKSRSDRIYGWFFVQRAAEFASVKSPSNRSGFRTFPQFVRRAGRANVNWTHRYEDLKEATSPSKLGKFLINLVENIFLLGRYKPSALLEEDSPFATQAAQDYVRALASFRPTVFIVRECQNIDPESLRFLLALVEETPHLGLIFEYTSAENKFRPDHEKIIFETVSAKYGLVIFDLLRLDMKEFRQLLRKYATADQRIEAAVELSWDGNLRIIKELKYRLMIGHDLGTPHPVLLPATIGENLDSLSRLKRLLLAIIASNVEAIGKDLLVTATRRIHPSTQGKEIDSELNSLVTNTKYIQIRGSKVAIADEDLADVLTASPHMTAMLRIAETTLRDCYLDVVRGSALATVPLQSAFRQALALCARTGDIVALRGLIRVLDSAIRQAYDQTLYVNMVAEVILGRDDLSEHEQLELVGWASAAAYEVGDYPTAISILELLPAPTSYEKALLACCYGEVNRHPDAIAIARELARAVDDLSSDVTIAGRLIECASLFALGQKEDAAEVHRKLRDDPDCSKSLLFGFVLRYTEIINDFPNCTEDMLKSAHTLRREGFLKASAYSALAAAMHLSYAGENQEARRLIAEAESELAPHVRDRQIILNDFAVVELLSPHPDVKSCLEKLNTALFSVRDEFSRLVLQNNRLICHWLLGDSGSAAHCAEIIRDILAEPAFGNRDVFWTVCFNAWSFFVDIGDLERAQWFKSLPASLGLQDLCYERYWNMRFHGVEGVEPEFNYLLKFKYHPEYLSHWIIDLEGLAVLKAKSAQ